MKLLYDNFISCYLNALSYGLHFLLRYFNKKRLYENNSVASGDINLYSFLGR